MTDKATRLYPLPPREIRAQSIYEDLELPPAGWSNASRPYVVINMISSLDGKTAVGGKASRLGSHIDRHTMRNLRSHADAVMIGANTLRAEKLSLGLDDPADRPQPLAVIATTTGDLPLQSHLNLGEGQHVLVLSPGEFPKDPSGGVNLAEALEVLKSAYGIDLLLVEGGPTLNHALISHRLADELFVTLAPRLLGGTSSDPRTVLYGQPLPPETSTPRLLSIHLARNELFLRYNIL